MHAPSGEGAPWPARESSPTPFEHFFREHYAAVVRLAASVVGDSHAAQDVAQEVFLAAHRRFGGRPDAAAGWVRVASVHTALNMVRGQRRRHRRHLLVGAAPHAPSPEEAVIDREAHAEVRRALAALPTRSATVLVLRYGGESYHDIAVAIGVDVGQVGTMLRRAESALCKEMERAPRT